MRIVIDVSKFFDWVAVPEDTEVTQKDINARRVKPALGGGWLMRLEVDQPTHTLITIGEDELISTMVVTKIRDRRATSRAQAAGYVLGSKIMPDEARPQWMKKIQVEDNGPESKEFFLNILTPHIECGNVSADDIDEMFEAYQSPFTNAELESFFAGHLGMKTEKEV